MCYICTIKSAFCVYFYAVYDHRSADNFIIEFNKKYGHNKLNKLNDTVLNDERRIVFVSLVGLFRSYKQCPSHVLFTCLLVLPLKKKWIYNPSRYQSELEAQFNGLDIFKKSMSPFSLIAMNCFLYIKQTHNKTKKKDNKATKKRTAEFIHLLKWKDSQGFVFWMLDHETSNDENTDHNDDERKQSGEEVSDSMIAPFWKYFSNELTKIYDPVSKKKYNPLHLSEEYWRDRYNDENSKFKTTATDILTELFFVQMKYATIQQVIFESNSDSLNPIISYNRSIIHNNNNLENSKETVNSKMHGDDNGFWISEDYICDSSHADIEYQHDCI